MEASNHTIAASNHIQASNASKRLGNSTHNNVVSNHNSETQSDALRHEDKIETEVSKEVNHDENFVI